MYLQLIYYVYPRNWPIVEKLLRRVHPGVGTLTTIEKMRTRWEKLGTPQFCREYLSMWPETYGVAVIDPTSWREAALTKPRPIPARVAFAFDVRPGGAYACLAAAWRDSRGVAYVSIVDHQQGTAWIPARAQELMKYRGATVAYDPIGESLATADEIATKRTPKVRLKPQLFRDTAAGCVQLLRDLSRGKLRHFGHPGLNYAVEHAAKREPRGSDSGVWLWTSSAPGADVSPLIAATKALRNWDQHFAKKAVGSGTGTTSFMGE